MRARSARTARTVPAQLAVAVLRGYQRWVGPVLPPACRYWPTCSEYARLAIARWGVFHGGLVAAGRLLRCQPLFPGGIDPPR